MWKFAAGSCRSVRGGMATQASTLEYGQDGQMSYFRNNRIQYTAREREPKAQHVPGVREPLEALFRTPSIRFDVAARCENSPHSEGARRRCADSQNRKAHHCTREALVERSIPICCPARLSRLRPQPGHAGLDSRLRQEVFGNLCLLVEEVLAMLRLLSDPAR